jgi:hypothetical protein
MDLIDRCARVALKFARASVALGGLAGSDDFAAAWCRCQELKADYIQAQIALREYWIMSSHIPDEGEAGQPQTELPRGAEAGW